MTLIQNEFLKVKISHTGAELISIEGIEGKEEYLWQADEKVWGRHAPILFPFVGKLADNFYSYNGANYTVGQHGFARDFEFELIDSSETAAVFALCANEQTRAMYPFDFCLKISYTLVGNALTYGVSVENNGTCDMPFGIGGHPGFICPFSDEGDYYIEFEKNETQHTYLIKDALFSEERRLVMNDENTIQLSHGLFAQDALILSDLNSSYLSIKSHKHSKAIKVSIDGWKYVGIWSKDDAPFVCIEPWTSTADYVGSNHNLFEKKDIIVLAPNQNYNNKFVIEISE